MFINPMAKECKDVKMASTRVKAKVAEVNLAKEILRGLKNVITYRGCNNYFFYVDGARLFNKVKPSKKYNTAFEYTAAIVNNTAKLLQKKGYTVDVYNVNNDADCLVYVSVNDLINDSTAEYNTDTDPIIAAALAYKNDSSKANTDKLNKEINIGIKSGIIIDHA